MIVRIRGRLRVLAGTLVLGLGMSLAAASPAAANEDGWGDTPGTYTNYSFPAGVTELTEVTWGNTVTTEPGITSYTFWSHQFGFNRGNGAYVGMQTNGGEPQLFLFSVWDVTEARVGSEGSWCQDFGDEGVGMSCRVRFPWQAGHMFAFKVAYEGDGWFGATVTDTTAGTSFKLGSIRTPASAIKTGGMVDWVEYYEWSMPRSTCLGQPYSSAFFALPQAVTPTGAKVTGTVSRLSNNGDCSNVRTESTSGGSVQTLGIENSVRGVVANAAGLCLDSKGVDAGQLAWADDETLARTENAQSVVDTCHQATDQGWVRGADSTLRLINDFCLTAGSSVTITTCGDEPGARRQWSVAADGTLRNVATGLCLTVPPGNGQAGRAVELATCHGTRNQQWTVPAGA